MAFGDSLYKPPLAPANNYDHRHKQQIIVPQRIIWKWLLCLTYGIAALLIYFMILLKNGRNSSDISTFISISFKVTQKIPNVSAVSTAPNVSLVTIGLYYLPAKEPQMARYRALKEHAYGTIHNGSNYPIGAHLLSDPSEYTIPSDRTPPKKNDRAFKYFKEMPGQNHMDVRFGNQNHVLLNNADRAAILLQLFAAWYVCSFRM
jgi:hypothetical protein